MNELADKEHTSHQVQPLTTATTPQRGADEKYAEPPVSTTTEIMEDVPPADEHLDGDIEPPPLVEDSDSDTDSDDEDDRGEDSDDGADSNNEVCEDNSHDDARADSDAPDLLHNDGVNMHAETSEDKWDTVTSKRSRRIAAGVKKPARYESYHISARKGLEQYGEEAYKAIEGELLQLFIGKQALTPVKREHNKPTNHPLQPLSHCEARRRRKIREAEGATRGQRSAAG